MIQSMYGPDGVQTTEQKYWNGFVVKLCLSKEAHKPDRVITTLSEGISRNSIKVL